MYYYMTVQPDDLQHYGILGMHWGVRRYQPYPSGYTGEGQYVGDSSVDRKAAKRNVKTAIRDLNKKGTKAYQATSELNKAKMVLGEEYVNKAIQRDNVRKASVKALKGAAWVAAAAGTVYAWNKAMGDYYSVSTKNGISELSKHMAGGDAIEKAQRVADRINSGDYRDITQNLTKAANRATEAGVKAQGALEYGSKVVGNRIKEQQVRAKYGDAAYGATKAADKFDEWMTKNVKNPLNYGGTVASNRTIEALTDPDTQDAFDEFLKKLK